MSELSDKLLETDFPMELSPKLVNSDVKFYGVSDLNVPRLDDTFKEKYDEHRNC